MNNYRTRISCEHYWLLMLETVGQIFFPIGGRRSLRTSIYLVQVDTKQREDVKQALLFCVVNHKNILSELLEYVFAKICIQISNILIN